MRRLFAVDPSLTCSGWALFCGGGGELLAVGKIRAKGPSIPMANRLKDLQEKVRGVFDTIGLDGNDVLVCEAPTTMRDPRAALVVEQVRGIFESVARELGTRVPGRINPRSVQYELMGLKGKQLKREIVKQVAHDVAERLFGEKLTRLGLPLGASKGKHQDIVDAVLLGAYGFSKITHAEKVGEPWENFFSQNEPRKRSAARLGVLGSSS
ncbi:MAG: hypothetical protein KDD70_00460 [Bdellovibrionales bacterium]|nr:hypothetical protein [Bdellovibrionales bacterium]